MTAHKRNLTIGLALLIIGMAIGYYLVVASQAAKNFDWQELSLDRSEKGHGYYSEALFNSYNPLPKIRKLSGKCKFLSTSTDSRSNELNLGYRVSVDIEKLDSPRVAQGHVVEKKKSPAGEFRGLPIEEVIYSVTFEFKLKDKDNVDLLKLKSPPHNLYAGKVNEFQDVVSQATPLAIAERVSSAILSMTVEKCETCK